MTASPHAARPWLPLPPRLVLLLLLVSFALRLLTAPGAPLQLWQLLTGATIALAGLSLTVSAARHFERAKTNIVTYRAPTHLVQDGWFRFSRNPMYLGFVLLLAGTGLALGGSWMLLPAAVFLLSAQLVYIPFEERAMARAFGENYERYCRRVRRWLGPGARGADPG